MPNFYEEPVAGGMSEKLWKDNQDLARMSLHHPFVQGLADGTLDPKAFKHYVAQDAFFLNGYIRALCYCTAKSDVTATEKDLLVLLDGVRREAEALHHNYIDSPEVDSPAPACRKFVDFLLSIGRADCGPSVMVAALIPCARLYAWIGKELTVSRDILEGHPYRDWLLLFAGEAVNIEAKTLEALLDEQVEACECEEVAWTYHRSMQLEYDFFDAFGGESGRPAGIVQGIPTVLVVSGSESGGGSGHQADLKTLEALGVYTTSALTSIAAQNTQGVQRVQVVADDLLAAQIDSVISDFDVSVVKVGSVPSSRHLRVVAEKLHGLPLVVDPVLPSAPADDSAAERDADDVLAVYKDRIFPLATVVTSTMSQARRLLGRAESIGVGEARSVARAVAQYGPKYVLVRADGDCPDGKTCSGVLYDRENEEFYEYTDKKISTTNTRGAGCTLASAIAGFMARGYPVPDAVERAIGYLHEIIARSEGTPLGQGPNRPLVHSANSIWVNYF
ncbi:hypothetical protein FOZ63_017202 [Perkinsus olseni]|uniref:Phosphomethylpyrimidine kinase n=1 Tax=Perkinsus olseni TaxID=32597 RepID=A0A7J6THD8_PEROL|nr:hypothetical protein FOZ63_017202 [Perkinsus olseni]KAF4743780.1 hypothetical protein FOZ62_012491 [Perkinsus olseni]